MSSEDSSQQIVLSCYLWDLGIEFRLLGLSTGVSSPVLLGIFLFICLLLGTGFRYVALAGQQLDL